MQKNIFYIYKIKLMMSKRTIELENVKKSDNIFQTQCKKYDLLNDFVINKCSHNNACLQQTVHEIVIFLLQAAKNDAGMLIE